jgi:putative sterol carrier protein
MHCQGVNEDSIFVASVNDQIRGLAILSITTEEGGLKQGNIMELQAQDVSSVHVLIQAALNYCKGKDVDTIVVVPPRLPGANVVFKDWLKLNTGVMMAKTLSLSSLLQALLSNEKIRIFFVGKKKKIVFQIGDDIIKVGNIDSGTKEPAILVIMSPQTFLKIVFGQVSPYMAYLTRRVRVRGVRNALSIVKLLCMMKLSIPLYVSLADRI